MAVTFTNVNAGDIIQAAHINELQGAMDGTAGLGKLIRFTNLDYDSGYAVVVGNQGTGGALQVLDSSGAALQNVTDAGVALLPVAGSARVTVGSGAFTAGIDAQITTPALLKIVDGSDGSPSNVRGPAVSISKIVSGAINDGVGAVLSLYGVRVVNDQNATAVPPVNAMDVLNIWGKNAAGGPGNMSGIYTRLSTSYAHKVTSEATCTFTMAAHPTVGGHYTISAVTLTGGGSGYTGPAVVILGGGNPVAHGTILATMNAGVVTALTRSLDVNNACGEYTTNTPPSARILPTGGSAFANVAFAGKSNSGSGSWPNASSLEVIGVELNPNNATGTNNSPDYAMTGYPGLTAGRSVGANVVCTGAGYHTAGVNIDAQSGNAWYTGLDMGSAALVTDNSGHPANVPHQAARFTNEGWLTWRSWQTTAGANTTYEPLLPLTIPVLKVNQADNVILNIDTGRLLAITTGRPGQLNAGTLTTLATLGLTGLTVSSQGGAPLTEKQYGSGAYPILTQQMAYGTIAAPSAVNAADQIMGGFLASAYHSGGAFATDQVGVVAYTGEAQTNTNRGTYLKFYTTPNGSTTLTERVRIVAGIQVGSPTGGDKGAGTINCAADIYKNNTAYTNPDYALEHFYTGRIVAHAGKPGAADYPGLPSLAEVDAYARAHHQLPRVGTRSGIFERSDIVLEKIEELFLYLMGHERRLAAIEAAIEADAELGRAA